MGQQGAGRGELRSWQTMNEDRERYNYRMGNPTANNYVPSISSARNRSSRGAGRGRVASSAATAAAPAHPQATPWKVPGSSRVLGSAPPLPRRPRPPPPPPPPRPAPAGVDNQDEAPLCTTASCTATRARAAAAIIALGLPYSETTLKPVFARGSCPAFLAPTAAALAAAELAASVRAATGRDVQCSLGRGRRSAAAAPQSPPLPPEPVVFNVMAVGGNGLGKSTLLHAMFAHEEFSERYPGLFPRTKRTVQVRSSHVLAEAGGRPLHLTLVDTPGLGDAADHARRFADILAYIDDCYCDYFNQDTDAHSRSRSDRRIHCCLYFIEPTGHDLQPFDVECMKELQDRVNVIPVIAKADTMSTYECYRFKRRLLREIAEQQIDVYDFPEVNPQEEQLRALKERLPFAVVGFNSELHEYGRKMMARRYPWGIAEVETLEHNDFSLLRKVLLQIHLCNLKEATEVHYENYRCRTLTPLSFDDFENLDDSKMENNRYYITFKPSIASSIADTLTSLNVVSSSSSSK